MLIGTQKRSYKNSKLNDEKIKLMCELPYFVLPESKEKKIIKSFEDTYFELKEWIIKNNKLPQGNSSDPNEKSLNTFIRNQKNKYKNNKLNDEQITLMNELLYFKFPETC